MSNFRALTLQAGVYTQIGNADGTVVGNRATTLSGNLNLGAAGTDISLDAGKNLSGAAGAGSVSFGSMTGTYSAPTGANTFGGSSNIFSAAVSANGGVNRSTGGVGSLYTDANTTTITIGGGAAQTSTTLGKDGQTTTNLGDLAVSGNLIVTGSTTTTSSEQVLINDNHLYLNNAYETVVAQTGGLVINYLPTATSDTVAAGGFTAGVAAVSNPTVATAAAATFALADIIQIAGATNPSNNGLFEVLSHAASVLTIRGIGTTGTVEDFTQNQFVTSAGAVGTIRKVNVSVVRAGTDGVWESGKGAVTPLVFSDFATATSVTLQQAYENGNTITTSAGEGNVTINGTEDFIVAGSVDLAFTSTGGFSWTAATGAINIQTTGAMTLRGGGVSIFGDDTAAWSFNGTGTFTTPGLVAGSITPSAALTLTAGAASTWSTSAGALTITSAAAATWSTAAGALTITSAAAATWSTAAGILTLNGTGGITFQGGATSALTINAAGTLITVQAGATLGTTSTGNINLPNNASAKFQIEAVAVSANVTAANLGTLTAGAASNADALHTHSTVSSAQMVTSGLTTTGLANGDFGYVSANNVMTKTDALLIASSRLFGVNEGTVGTMTIGGIIESAKMTTAGGSPSAGAPVFLAESTEEASAAGKATATAPSTAASVVAEVGIVLDNSNYAALKTVVLLIQVKSPIQLA